MADIRIDIIVNSKQAVSGANAATAALKKTNALSQSLGRSLIRTFAVFGALRAVKNAIKTLAAFENSMATVKAISGATELEMEKFRNTAKQLGITTAFSAVEAADALVTLSRAGFSVRESTAAVGDVLNLARAGGLGLADAADIAASSLRSFRIDAQDAARVTDVLTSAANSSNTTVKQLGQGIKFVGPIAKSLGVDFETTSAALGKLSDAGLKATLAGTGLRGILAKLQAPSKAFKKVLDELKISQDSIKVSSVGLIPALEALKAGGLEGSRALEAFGLRAGPAFAVLVEQIPALREFVDELRNAGGEAQKTADIIDQSLQGAFIRTESAYKGLTIALGEQGPVNALTQALEGLTAVLKFVAENAALAFTFLAPLAILIATKVTAAVTGVGAALAKFNPLLLVGTGLVASISLFFTKLNKELATSNERFKELSEEVNLAPFGQAVTAAGRAITALRQQIERVQEAGGVISPAQLEEITRLENNIEAATKAFKANIEAQKEAAKVAADAPFQQVLDRLDRELELLRRVNDEREKEGRLADELAKIAKGGQAVGEDNGAELLRRKINLIEALKEENKALATIGNPQKDYNKDKAILDRLLIKGKISLEVFNTKLQKVQETLKKETTSPFQKVIQDIQEEIRLQNKKAALFPDIIKFKEEELRITGGVRDLTALEGIELLANLALLNKATDASKERLAVQKQQVAEEKARKKLQETIDKATGKTARDAIEKLRQRGKEGGSFDLSTGAELSAVTKLGDGIDVINRRLVLVNDLNKEGTLGFLDWGRAVKELSDKGAEGISFWDKSLVDLVTTIDLVADAFANTATNAILEFIETGKFSFKEFAQDIIKQILRIIVQLLVMKALQGLGVGGAAASAAGGAAGGALAREHGGTVQPGRDFIVGENGPERVRFGRTAAVTPNPASVSQEPPQINQQIVIVKDPNEIPQVLASGIADDAIMTIIARNADKVAKLTP